MRCTSGSGSNNADTAIGGFALFVQPDCPVSYAAQLPLTSLRRPEFWPAYHPSASQPSPVVPAEGIDYPINEMRAVPAQTVVLGKPLDYPSFGWDNEYGRKVIEVQAFKATTFKVTNGEFLAFVKSGGYSTPKYWSTEGWGWKTFRNVKWPTFWIPDGPQGLHRWVQMPVQRTGRCSVLIQGSGSAFGGPAGLGLRLL